MHAHEISPVDGLDRRRSPVSPLSQYRPRGIQVEDDRRKLRVSNEPVTTLRDRSRYFLVGVIRAVYYDPLLFPTGIFSVYKVFTTLLRARSD